MSLIQTIRDIPIAWCQSLYTKVQLEKASRSNYVPTHVDYVNRFIYDSGRYDDSMRNYWNEL